jgi:hypothetical protein
MFTKQSPKYHFTNSVLCRTELTVFNSAIKVPHDNTLYVTYYHGCSADQSKWKNTKIKRMPSGSQSCNAVGKNHIPVLILRVLRKKICVVPFLAGQLWCLFSVQHMVAEQGSGRVCELFGVHAVSNIHSTSHTPLSFCVSGQGE